MIALINMIKCKFCENESYIYIIDGNGVQRYSCKQCMHELEKYIDTEPIRGFKLEIKPL